MCEKPSVINDYEVGCFPFFASFLFTLVNCILPYKPRFPSPRPPRRLYPRHTPRNHKQAGRAIPNPNIINKLDRALGVHLPRSKK